MNQIEFKSFGKIEPIGKLYMTITQKLHGTNTQILIVPKDQNNSEIIVLCGSRTRWLTPEDDNYGFCKFVLKHKQEFIDKLGYGRHYGEWVGPGINSGEGLSEKRLYLFNHERWKNQNLPHNVGTVPVLYCGKFDLNAADYAMYDLKYNGSKISPGFMKPEGIVIQIGNQYFKNVFDKEEISWAGVKKERIARTDPPDVTHLLQPFRLEKLISRDEKYLREYPESLRVICADYIADLLEEQQITGTEEEIKLIKKSLGKVIFGFIKNFIPLRYPTNA